MGKELQHHPSALKTETCTTYCSQDSKIILVQRMLDSGEGCKSGTSRDRALLAKKGRHKKHNVKIDPYTKWTNYAM